jgi:hypothetical protein
MRALLWSLLAALLILTGYIPGLAAAIGSLLLAALLLIVHGAALLAAQPAIQIIAGLVAAVWLIRTRRLA